MELRINESILLATGQTSSEAIVCILNPRMFINEKMFTSEISCWITLDSKNSGIPPTGLAQDGSNPTRFVNTINSELTQNDIDNGIIYADYVKNALVQITGCSIGNIEIL